MNKLKIYLLLTILLVSLITACAKPASQLSAAELLDLGEKYLLEMNYEQAVVCFTKLIAIEPKNPRGYTGLAEAYVGLGEFDKALEVLRQGLGQLPDNVEIAELLEELEASAGDNSAANPATKPSGGAEGAIDVQLTADQLALLKPLEEALLAFDAEAAIPLLESAAFKELCRGLPKKSVNDAAYEAAWLGDSLAVAAIADAFNVCQSDAEGVWALGYSVLELNADAGVNTDHDNVTGTEIFWLLLFDDWENGRILQVLGANSPDGRNGWQISDFPIVDGIYKTRASVENAHGGDYEESFPDRFLTATVIDGKVVTSGEPGAFLNILIH
jgi:hypothetical protein